MKDTLNCREEVKWAPRLKKETLKRFYHSESSGRLTEGLIEEIGFTLYLRCKSILDVTRAMYQKEVTCPRCQRNGLDSIVLRKGGREEKLTCDKCGWSLTWKEYQSTFKRKQLHGGGAVDAFQNFIKAWDLARTESEKILAIDRVIHEFHYSNKNNPNEPTRPAGVNLIVGKIEDVVSVLDEISGISRCSEQLRESAEQWKGKISESHWPKTLAERKREN